MMLGIAFKLAICRCIVAKVTYPLLLPVRDELVQCARLQNSTGKCMGTCRAKT